MTIIVRFVCFGVFLGLFLQRFEFVANKETIQTGLGSR